MNIKLIELKPEEAKNRHILLSPDGKIYTLVGVTCNDIDFIIDIAEEIVKKENLEHYCGRSPLFLLLSLGYLYRANFCGWDWEGYSINNKQLTIARKFGYNHTIEHLANYHFRG